MPTSSQSEANVPTVPHKKKVVASDTSATSCEVQSTFALIKNLKIGELLELFGINKVHNPAYMQIQEFLTKVTSLYLFFPSIFSISYASSLSCL